MDVIIHLMWSHFNGPLIKLYKNKQLSFGYCYLSSSVPNWCIQRILLLYSKKYSACRCNSHEMRNKCDWKPEIIEWSIKRSRLREMKQACNVFSSHTLGKGKGREKKSFLLSKWTKLDVQFIINFNIKINLKVNMSSISYSIHS